MKCSVFGILLSCVISSNNLLATEVMPQISIIIDDLGTNWQQAEKILSLPIEVTTSILPFTPHAKKIALQAKSQGRTVMLHVPMEANEHNDLLGPGALRTSMGGWQLLTQLRKNIVSLPGVKGVNNHMGSRMTQESSSMRWVMALLKWQGLYFIDSRTTAKTVAEDVADSMGVTAARRDVFLDHKISEEAINQQFDRLLSLARAQGSAIAIGHPHPETIRVLKQRLPQLVEDGIRLVKPETLILERNKTAVASFKYSSSDEPLNFTEFKEFLLNMF